MMARAPLSQSCSTSEIGGGGELYGDAGCMGVRTQALSGSTHSGDALVYAYRVSLASIP